MKIFTSGKGDYPHYFVVGQIKNTLCRIRIALIGTVSGT